MACLARCERCKCAEMIQGPAIQRQQQRAPESGESFTNCEHLELTSRWTDSTNCSRWMVVVFERVAYSEFAACRARPLGFGLISESCLSGPVDHRCQSRGAGYQPDLVSKSRGLFSINSKHLLPGARRQRYEIEQHRARLTPASLLSD